jgi:hypothetical protein
MFGMHAIKWTKEITHAGHESEKNAPKIIIHSGDERDALEKLLTHSGHRSDGEHNGLWECPPSFYVIKQFSSVYEIS